MKILKIVTAILLALVVVFCLLGVFKPTHTYGKEILIDKPVSETWSVIQDEEKLKDWLTDIQRIEHFSGTPGRVGAVSDVYFMQNDQETVVRETITDIQPGESMSSTYTSDFMDMDYVIKLTPTDGKSKISSSTIVKGNGFFARSIVALIGGSMEKQEDTNLANLKRVVEENKKIY